MKTFIKLAEKRRSDEKNRIFVGKTFTKWAGEKN